MGNITLKSLLAVDSHVINPLVYQSRFATPVLPVSVSRTPRAVVPSSVSLVHTRLGEGVTYELGEK